MEPIQTILSNILSTIALKIPKWIRMKLFNAEKWVGRYFIIEPKVEKFKAEKKERWKALPNYPFNRVWMRIPWDNRSQCDVELKELFLRVFVNHAPFKYIMWNKREIQAGIKIPTHLEKEFDVFNAKETEKGFVFRKNSKGLLDVYIYLPSYIDTNSDVYIELIGYGVFDSPFGEFIKKIWCEKIRVAPEDWKK